MKIDGDDRVLEAPTCEALTDAIALVLLVAFDPAAAQSSLSEVGPKPIQPKMQDQAVTPSLSATPPVMVPRTRESTRFYGGIEALSLVTPFTDPSLGASLYVGWERPHGFDIHAGVSFTTTRPFGPGSAALFDLTTVTADACPLAWTLTEGFEMRPCAGGTAGFSRGEGQAVAQTQSASAVWADAHALIRLKIRAGGWTFAPSAGVLVPLTRPTYVFERPRIEVHTVPAAAVFFALGLERRFL